MASIRVDANFPGGAVENVEINNLTIVFEAPLDNSPQSLWYFFRVIGAQGQRLTLIQKGLDHVLGVHESRGYGPVVPVWKDGEDGPWQRVEENTIQYIQNPLTFRFEVEPTETVCYVAFCYPYLMENWLSFLKTLPADHISEKTICTTKAGRPMVRYLLRLPNAHPKHLIVLTARQHAGEVSGSFVLEGILRRLLDGSMEMKKLLEKVCFCIVPIMDQDCVQEGRYGKDQSPCDFNRDWHYRPYHPEILGLQEELEQLGQQYEILWAFDLHAPQPGAASYMPPARSSRPHSRLWNRMWNMALAYEANCRNHVSFHLHDVDTQVLNWGGMNNHALVEYYYAVRWNCNLTCLEYAYHRDGEQQIVEIGHWNELGKILAKTIADKIFDKQLNAKPDINIIPAWTIPYELKAWDSATQIKGMSIQDDLHMATFTATETQNKAWLTSPVPKGKEQKGVTWELLASQPIVIRIYASYYRNGLLTNHSKVDTLSLEPNLPMKWHVPPTNRETDGSTIGVILQNISGTLTVRKAE